MVLWADCFAHFFFQSSNIKKMDIQLSSKVKTQLVLATEKALAEIKGSAISDSVNKEVCNYNLNGEIVQIQIFVTRNNADFLEDDGIEFGVSLSNSEL